MADPEANVIYGIVTDESMGDAVKVTVIATGFNTRRSARSRPRRWTSPTTSGRGRSRSGHVPQAEAGGFYRKTPNAKAASGGGRLDLDVPAFLRKQGGGGGAE